MGNGHLDELDAQMLVVDLAFGDVFVFCLEFVDSADLLADCLGEQQSDLFDCPVVGAGDSALPSEEVVVGFEVLH